METVQLATRIDSRIKKTVDLVCKQRGLKLNKFVEEALLSQLEELEDIADIQALRKEASRPLSEIMKDLKKHGKL